jgi:hypothetical protein
MATEVGDIRICKINHSNGTNGVPRQGSGARSPCPRIQVVLMDRDLYQHIKMLGGGKCRHDAASEVGDGNAIVWLRRAPLC